MAFSIIPQRKNMRLQGYDYSQAGGYYITVVAQGREYLFGEIHNDEMSLNNAGKMVTKWWNKLPGKFPSVTVDAFVVMPNHIHGIILIHETVGADPRVGPGDLGNHKRLEKKLDYGVEKGAHTGAPLRNNGMGDTTEKGEHTEGEHIGSPLRTNVPLSQIVQWYKTMTTNEYIRGVKQSNWPRFIGKLWQRNYYEHIIRNEQDYERIFNYIDENPANWAEDEENR
jgi:putative transposase